MVPLRIPLTDGGTWLRLPLYVLTAAGTLLSDGAGFLNPVTWKTKQFNR